MQSQQAATPDPCMQGWARTQSCLCVTPYHCLLHVCALVCLAAVAAKERKRAATAERNAATAQGEVAALRQQLAELQAANSQGSQ
jgi:hypothetical protein